MQGTRSAAAWRSPAVLRVGKGVSLYLALLLVVVTAYGQVPLPQYAPPPNPKQQIPKQLVPASVPGGFTVAAVGDLIIDHPETATFQSEFASVKKLIQGADISFGNLEESLVDPGKLHVWPAAAAAGGDDINGPPSLAVHLKEMGFDLLSTANNHSMNFGIRGMEATNRILDKAGLVHAGTGPDLAAARAPRYLTTPSGRIALVAMTSSFTPLEPAGKPLRGVAGRPGVSVLHTTLYHVVTPKQMSWLHEIYNSKPRKPIHPATSSSNKLYLFGIHYLTGPYDGLTYTMNPYDLNGILRAIRQGNEESDFEIAYIHAHNPGNWSKKPADFLPKLAHDVINAGADEFVASGPHRLRGIEIYKGKPIFYSLGNFFFEVGQLRFLNADRLRRFQRKLDTTTDWEYQQYNLMRLHFNAPVWYQSIVAVSVFNANGDVREIKLYPIDLGYERKPRTEVGVPWPAPPKMARRILVRLKKLSEPFGTNILIQNGVGVIKVSQ